MYPRSGCPSPWNIFRYPVLPSGQVICDPDARSLMPPRCIVAFGVMNIAPVSKPLDAPQLCPHVSHVSGMQPRLAESQQNNKLNWPPGANPTIPCALDLSRRSVNPLRGGQRQSERCNIYPVTDWFGGFLPCYHGQASGGGLPRCLGLLACEQVLLAMFEVYTVQRHSCFKTMQRLP